MSVAFGLGSAKTNGDDAGSCMVEAERLGVDAVRVEMWGRNAASAPAARGWAAAP